MGIVKSVEEKLGSEELSLYEIKFGHCLYSIEVTNHCFFGCFYT